MIDYAATLPPNTAALLGVCSYANTNHARGMLAGVVMVVVSYHEDI
jgi:hypothetical protein